MTKRMWIPTKGRLERRNAALAAEGHQFLGAVVGLATLIGFTYLVYS